LFKYGEDITLTMELLIKRLQAKEAEIAQYLTIIQTLQQQLKLKEEECNQCTENENPKNQNQNQKKDK